MNVTPVFNDVAGSTVTLMLRLDAHDRVVLRRIIERALETTPHMTDDSLYLSQIRNTLGAVGAELVRREVSTTYEEGE